ncbi:hypothetical protein IV203_000844 [Nitzschia inconspicua]|uniref:Uncharacterized protein n=1 Tax=Nitzschia inconspicua TaxID=303405 RepID=A0A9K3PR34_9STRA|nr:hypothetical protein IV203_000844 [Nitzschia inconspicua]
MIGRSLSVPETHDNFGFVLIEADEGVLRDSYMPDYGGQEGHDDDSYDYCEDACSVSSNDEDSSSASLMDMKESILSVPDTLMKDLDEAHAAAKLVHFEDDVAQVGEGRSTSSFSPRKSDHYSSASSVVSMEEEDDEDSAPKNRKNDSSSSFHTTDSNGMDEEMEDSPNGSGPSLPVPNGVIKDHNSISTVQATLSMANSKEGTGSMSRTSNKKRRKKLKMLKKAQAAASAATKLAEKSKNLSDAADTVSSKKTKGRQNHVAPKIKPRSPKKPSNIAVACATETMAAYRQELMVQGIK